ncbi:MAG: hydantoinase B/oxoprolinase family protein [Thermodesulfobacteriota bacterium]|nr:hydantoinase B/oxoprolinase family protein [Thermodesulfobacteriota bacterium]
MDKEEYQLDPITYEVIKHRIWQILWEGRVAMQKVSGSPVATEAKEVMFSIYNEKGETVASSAGLLLHVIGAEGMIKFIIENYSEKPGIYDGDVFFFNDPYIGGCHGPDQACIAPYYYKEKLVGWIAALFHTVETGAIEPGGMPPSATEIFHEGLRVPGLKVMDRGEENTAFYKLLERSVRDPVAISLDTRARVAGINVGKERLLSVINRYGLDSIREVFYRMVEDSEKSARAKLRELPDGSWQAVCFMDHDGRKYSLQKIKVKVTKKGEDIILDFTGTDPQSPGPTNCAYPSAFGNCFVAISSLLFWEENWNRGTMNAVKVIVPEGTLVNARWPAAVGMSPAYPGEPMSNILDICFSKMFVTKEKYYGDQTAAWASNYTGVVFGGINQHGEISGGVLFDILAGGQGAGPDLDGSDSSVFQMTPEVISSDIEIYESMFPFIYVSRYQAPDSGGPGKQRGGVGLEVTYLVHNTPGAQVVMIGEGKLASSTPGIYGGYPAAPVRSIHLLNNNIKEWIQRGELPYTFEDIREVKGELRDNPPMVSAVPMGNFDLIYTYGTAGGGYGDPIDRLPEAVFHDVINQLVTIESAREIYGVIFTPEAKGLITDPGVRRELKIDENATKKRREEIREKRKRRAGQ